MLFKEIIAIDFENYMKHIDKLWVLTCRVCNVKAVGLVSAVLSAVKRNPHDKLSCQTNQSIVS
jgi:hypothetical protein